MPVEATSTAFTPPTVGVDHVQTPPTRIINIAPHVNIARVSDPCSGGLGRTLNYNLIILGHTI